MNKILNFCRQKKLYLIEDCAHSFGATFRHQPVGTFGDLTVLSFGRDKLLSSVFGGALIVNQPELVEPVNCLYQKIAYPPKGWTAQQLVHPLITTLAKIAYPFYLGCLFLFLTQKLKLISKAIYPQERHHQTPKIFPTRLSEPLAALALRQLEKIDRFNRHRRQIAAYYQKYLTHPAISKPTWDPEGVYLRYTVTLNQPEKLKECLRKNGYVIEQKHWYRQPVTPSENLTRANYQAGQCPVAEEICQKCLNLPTHPLLSLRQARKLVKIVNQWQP
jgi:dTDP-4-amino-4,6-dideoxygalactose transaminase